MDSTLQDEIGPSKRPRTTVSDSRYPRKRSSKACHVCRARKTKCDNARPACSFCVSVNISCSYDDTDKDHSSFDPASSEILRQLHQIIDSQKDLLDAVQYLSATQPTHAVPDPSSTSANYVPLHAIGDGHDSNNDSGIPLQNQFSDYDWFAPRSESEVTSPAASTGVAAVQWFGLLTRDSYHEVQEDAPSSFEGSYLDQLSDHEGTVTTPLQHATKIIDVPPPEQTPTGEGTGEEVLWQANQNIVLLPQEQTLFANFLNRICSWIDLFDAARKFSTIVPRLATRNAGLLNAILALSSYHQSLDETISEGKQKDHQNSAIQYYYQTLHYVQKAMRYSTYQHSLELMATTLIISTYEMLRGSRRDWQQHLQGVFWILRSRQIEVETSSLESTTWWAWLRQDIWVAFREKRRTFSTWVPRKPYSELNSHEIASRAVWILAQVINFYAVKSDAKEASGSFEWRLGWAKALRRLIGEWKANLTVEFSEMNDTEYQDNQIFRPRFMHPQCFGVAMQIHHVSKILVCAHEPSHGTLENFMARQKTIQDSIEVVFGIGSTITEEASSLQSSQCLFIAGMFLQSARQRIRAIEMLDECRIRCGYLTPSLSSELEQIWAKPDELWGNRLDGFYEW